MKIPRHWRLRKQRYGLVGNICRRCGYKLFPPRDLCPNCSNEAKEFYTFNTQLADLGELPLEIGMPVEMVTHKMQNAQ
jgi:uncharacterized OB-fold protein